MTNWFHLGDLEKRGLMKVEEKSGLFGPKVELYLTDKGSFIAREAEAKIGFMI